jgi:hypothetical protein
MQLRNLGLALTALCALTPDISRADRVAFHACVNAFEKTLDAPSGQGHAFHVVFGGEDAENGSIARFYRVTSVYDLSANDPKTGAVIARMRCSADNRGVVSSLLPLSDDLDSRSVQRPARVARE